MLIFSRKGVHKWDKGKVKAFQEILHNWDIESKDLVAILQDWLSNWGEGKVLQEKKCWQLRQNSKILSN